MSLSIVDQRLSCSRHAWLQRSKLSIVNGRQLWWLAEMSSRLKTGITPSYCAKSTRRLFHLRENRYSKSIFYRSYNRLSVLTLEQLLDVKSLFPYFISLNGWIKSKLISSLHAASFTGSAQGLLNFCRSSFFVRAEIWQRCKKQSNGDFSWNVRFLRVNLTSIYVVCIKCSLVWKWCSQLKTSVQERNNWTIGFRTYFWENAFKVLECISTHLARLYTSHRYVKFSVTTAHSNHADVATVPSAK